MNQYRIADLVVASELDLPFADRIEPGSQPDIVVRRGDVPDAFASPSGTGPCWMVEGNSCLLEVPGLIRCLVSAGKDITFQASESADDADAAAFALGTAFGVCLHQRGLMVLHAAAVEVGGRAMLFSGPSGAGKSTIAAALTERGYPIVADDVCIIDFAEDGTPFVRSDGRLVRLWSRTVEALQLSGRRRERVRTRIEKFYVAPSQTAAERRYPVGAAYRLLTEWRQAPSRIVPLDSIGASVLLRQSAYRPRYIRAANLESRQFRDVTRMASRVPVFELWRRIDFDALTETVARLESDWCDRGWVPSAT